MLSLTEFDQPHMTKRKVNKEIWGYLIFMYYKIILKYSYY